MPRRATLLNYGLMGRSEFARLSAPPDYAWLRALAPGGRGAERDDREPAVVALYVRDDLWAPVALARALATAGGLGGAVRVVEGEGVAHAFVTSDAGIAAVVDALAPELARYAAVDTAAATPAPPGARDASCDAPP